MEITETSNPVCVNFFAKNWWRGNCEGERLRILFWQIKSNYTQLITLNILFYSSFRTFSMLCLPSSMKVQNSTATWCLKLWLVHIFTLIIINSPGDQLLICLIAQLIKHSAVVAEAVGLTPWNLVQYCIFVLYFQTVLLVAIKIKVKIFIRWSWKWSIRYFEVLLLRPKLPFDWRKLENSIILRQKKTK